MPSASSIAAAVVAVPCGEQVYQRNEGIALVQKLPRAARLELIHHETVALTREFQPLPPLHATAALACQSYVWVAVTDWSLYVLECSSSRNSETGVLLELPWLWVKDLGAETIDSDQVLEPVNGRRFKSSLVNITPQVDTHWLPPSIQQQVQRAADALATGATPEAAHTAAQGLSWFRRLFGSSKPKSAATSEAASNSVLQHAAAQHTSYQPAYFAVVQPQHAQQGLHQSLQGTPASQYGLAGTHATQWIPAPVTSTAAAAAAGQSIRVAAHGSSGPLGESVEGQYWQQQQQQQPQHAQYMQPSVHQHQVASLHSWLQQPASHQQQQQQPCMQWQQAYPTVSGYVSQPPHLQHACTTASSTTHGSACPYQLYQPQPGTWQQARVTAVHSLASAASSSGKEPPNSPSRSWSANGRGTTCWAPPTRLPAPTPLHLKAPVLQPIIQPQPDEQWQADNDPLEAADIVLSSYMLSLVTVEPRSRLACHMRRAWLTAHMRYSAACSAVAGVPVWYAPPPSHTSWLRPTHMPLQPVPHGGSLELLRGHVLKHLGNHSSASLPTTHTNILHQLFPEDAAVSAPGRLAHKSMLLHSSNAAHSCSQETAHSVQCSITSAQAALLESLTLQLAAGMDSRQLTSAQVHEAFHLAELRMQASCSLWDDDDELLIKELLLSVGLCSTSTARSMGVAFFNSCTAMSFITSRIMAWGALCTMYGPTAQQAASTQSVTPYVQWVLSRNRHLTDDTGRLLSRFDSPPQTPWSAAQHRNTSSPRAPAWESPAYDPYKTPRLRACTPDAPTCDMKQAGQAATQGYQPWFDAATLEPATPSHVGMQGQCHMKQPQTPASLQLPTTVHECSEPQACAAPVTYNSTTTRRYEPSHSASRRIDELTGKTASTTQQQYDFFLHLYNLRNWHSLEGQAGAHSTQHVLSMLGLARGCNPSIHGTYTSVCRLIHDATSMGSQGRSKPPPVQAPPTLAPYDPLSLSPLSEQPYLFSLNLNAAASPARPVRKAAKSACSATQQHMTSSEAQVQQGYGNQRSSIATTCPAGSNAVGHNVSSNVFMNAVEGSVTQTQKRVQGTFAGRMLQDVFMSDVYTDHAPINEGRTQAQARWERLVGKLAASVAWRKLRLLLRWLHAMTDLSQSCTTSSAMWMSDKVCEAVPLQQQQQLTGTVPALGALTWRDCTCLMASLLPQLADPTGDIRRQQQPTCSSDMLWWCRSEAGAPGRWLDHVAGISWALSGMSTCEAAGAHRPAGEPNIVVQATRQLPASLAHAYCKRLLCRTVALLSDVAGVSMCQPHSAASAATAGVACATAAQAGEVLLLLLENVPGAAATLHDSLDHRLLHTLRTPQVAEALSNRSNATGPVLGPLATSQLHDMVMMLADAHVGTRPATWYKPGLSHSTLANLGSCVGRHKLPGALT